VRERERERERERTKSVKVTTLTDQKRVPVGKHSRAQQVDNEQVTSSRTGMFAKRRENETEGEDKE